MNLNSSEMKPKFIKNFKISNLLKDLSEFQNDLRNLSNNLENKISKNY